MPQSKNSLGIKFHPVTPSRWKDFVQLFGDNGACGGCWCMAMRQTQSDYTKKKGAANKRAIKKIIDSNKPPGVIGYIDNEPAAWCCVGKREEFVRLDKSRTLKPLDEQQVWSITCLFVARPYRKSGVSAQAVEAAAKYAFSKGAKIIEGYPYYTGQKKWADPFVWMGLVNSFTEAGFEIVKRPSKSRAIVRRYKNPSKSSKK